MYFADLEKKIDSEEPKTAFDKLSDFLELEKSEKSYRDKFLELLDNVVEEEIKELENK